jgi:Acetyltransferase (GNAT) domain
MRNMLAGSAGIPDVRRRRQFEPRSAGGRKPGDRTARRACSPPATLKRESSSEAVSCASARSGSVSFRTGLIPHIGGKASLPAVRLLCAFAFGELGVERLEAYIEPDNVASRRVVESLGFSEEGLARARELPVYGERRDMVVYSLLPYEL